MRSTRYWNQPDTTTTQRIHLKIPQFLNCIIHFKKVMSNSFNNWLVVWVYNLLRCMYILHWQVSLHHKKSPQLFQWHIQCVVWYQLLWWHKHFTVTVVLTDSLECCLQVSRCFTPYCILNAMFGNLLNKTFLCFREQNRIGKIISDPVSDYKPPSPPLPLT